MTRPNVLVLVLDTARAHNVSCYGYSRETSPNLDRIASEGVRFDNAITNAPWTLPSHASMFTGRLPFDHEANAREYRLSPDVPTLAERLGDEGYSTTIISNNGWLSEGFGLLRGFENRYKLWKLFQTETNIVEPYREHVKNTNLLRNPGNAVKFGTSILRDGNLLKDAANLAYGVYHRDDRHHSGERITKLLKNEISAAEGPFFAVANYLEPHLKYFPPEPYRSRFLPDDVTDEEARSVCQDVYEVQFGSETLTEREWKILESLYDGEIAHVDDFVGQVYQFLADEGHLDDTLLVILGDHGENIGQQGLLGHNSSLTDTVLRVPFVVRPPGGGPGTVESRYVQPTDLYRTVLDATGVNAPRTEAEFSFDVLSPDLDARPEMAVSQYAGLQLEVDRIEAEYPDVELDAYDRSLVSVYHADHKLVRDERGDEILYEVGGEDREVPRSDTDGPRDQLASILDEYDAGLERRGENAPEFDAAIKKRLQDLGYHK